MKMLEFLFYLELFEETSRVDSNSCGPALHVPPGKNSRRTESSMRRLFSFC